MGEQEGLAFRSRLKLHMPDWMVKGEEKKADETVTRKLWPLSTSLHNTDVAGPGLILHFDFQAALIIWSCIFVACWVCFSYSIDAELLLIGIKNAAETNIAESCAGTVRGKRMQRDLMTAKVMFLVGAYVCTLAACVGYSIFHKRKYQNLDANTTSMRDFAAILRGLPRTVGTERLEEQLSQCLREATGQSVVGVSVCWDFKEKADLVNKHLEAEVLEIEMESGVEAEVTVDAEVTDADGKAIPQAIVVAEVAEQVPPPLLFRWIDKTLWLFVGVSTVATKDSEPLLDDASPMELVDSLTSSDTAFVVFETEEARDAAVQVSIEANGSLEFKGSSITLEPVPNEPDTVCWEHFSVEEGRIPRRACVGGVVILMASLLWCTLFYLPYAYYYTSFAYVKNVEPDTTGTLTFTGLVVAGNLAMYAICQFVAYSVGYRFSCDAEAFYIVTYTFSCFLNVLIDLGLESIMTRAALVAADAYTADGIPIANLTSYHDLFESYPMQKSLGNRLFWYCFPGTFLLGFVAEPFAQIFLPYHLMRILLSKYAGIRGRSAEKAMDFFAPMDLSRYGDLTLNVSLVVLICLFPSGEMMKIFLAFILSHTFVYFYDTYRVLRCVPGFCFAGDICDNVAQILLTIPCGILAVCIVVKGNSILPAEDRLEDGQVSAAVAGAFILHVILHFSLIRCCSPLFSKGNKAVAEMTYAEKAPDIPCNWFSANPVHCLRSKHVYGDEPRCVYFIRGHEHNLRANPKIGCHFEDRKKHDLEEDWGGIAGLRHYSEKFRC
jgi:hypothetical protein